MVFKKIAAFLSAAALSAVCCITALAGEADDKETELIPEFDNEIIDDAGDYPVQFTIGFGTHEKMPDGTSAKLVLYSGEGCEIEGMDENGQRVYVYSSVASDRYVCRKSSNGGYYPTYGEIVRLKPQGEQNLFRAVLMVSDRDNNELHSKETYVYILKRDNVIVLSDTGYDDCEEKLDKPLYRVLLFFKTPLGTVTKILLFVLLVGGMFSLLHMKEIKRYFRAKKAKRRERIIEQPHEKISDDGGKDNG